MKKKIFSSFLHGFLNCSENDEIKNEYLLTVTGVKKMKWFLSLKRCHFQPRVTEGHELEVDSWRWR